MIKSSGSMSIEYRSSALPRSARAMSTQSQEYVRQLHLDIVAVVEAMENESLVET